MARLHLTEAEARKLGITAKTTRTKTRRRAPGLHRTVCQCGLECFSDKEEERHVDETGHARFEVVQ